MTARRDGATRRGGMSRRWRALAGGIALAGMLAPSLVLQTPAAATQPAPAAAAKAAVRTAALTTAPKQAPHTVTYDKYSFKIDGKPTYIWSAEFHYFRLPSPDAWRDVLQKVKSAGFNAVSLYFAWSYHSPAPGVYDFTGIRDVDRLLTMAEETGLYVIARPGPYINAEISGGGFPAWRKTRPGVNRTSEPGYMNDAREWLRHINPIIAKHLYTKGTGSVILYQIENEYQGGRNDRAYMQALQDWARQDGIDVPTFINDGGTNGNWIDGPADMYGWDAYPQGFDCKSPEVWRDLPDYSWLRKWSPKTPMIIPEGQGGSFDPWGGHGFDKCRQLTGTDFTRVFSKMNLAAGVAMQNFYMTFGGTNWGWLADPNAVYTSYDYGAPITEARRLSGKYAEFKRLGHFLAAVKSIARTDVAEAPKPDDAALRIDRRVNPDDGAQFFFLRHADTRVTEAHTTRFSLSGRDGNYPTVPQQGTVAINGRDAKVLVAGYDMGGQRLVYSTSEIMTHAKIGDRDTALLYGPDGQDGETVLRYASKPTIKVLAGGVQSTWDATRGDLRLNYTHRSAGPARVLISGGGRPALELVLGTDTEAGAWWQQQTTAGPVLVRGPNLVRTATASGSTLALTGDTTAAGALEVIAPPSVREVTWNGRVVAVKGTAAGSLAGKLNHKAGAVPRKVTLPALTNWRTREEAPESAPGFDDSTWTVADHLTAVHPTLAGTLPVLAMDEYGYHHGDVWYRGRFAGTGKETTVAVTAAPGNKGVSAVWLNGRYLGASGDRTHQYDIPAGVLRPGVDNVLAVLVENMGHNEEWGHDFSKEPRGLISASLIGGATTITWKIQGNRGGQSLVDPVRGPFNAGGLYGERAGWHLPGFRDNRWFTTQLPDGGRQPGLRWYRTNFSLNLPTNQDTTLGLRIDDSGDKHYRAHLYVNGWMVGQYINDVGPQREFVIPRGLLNEHGRNTVAMAVWSTDSSGLGKVRLTNMGSVAGGPAIGTVPAPGWNKQTYAMPVAKAGLSVDAAPYLPTGTSADVGVTFTVPATAAGARDVSLALTAPDGWKLQPDGPTSQPKVRPGQSFTARWTVTSAGDAQPYTLLTAKATFTQRGADKSVTERRAVQVPPPAPTGEKFVSDLPLVRAANGWGPVEKDKSNGEGGAGDGQRLTIAGTGYDKGLGVHPFSSVRVWLGGKCTSFSAVVGVDDEVGDSGSVVFSVVGDDKSLAKTGTLTGASPGEELTVDVTGVRWLDLEVTDSGDNVWSDHADWADARISCT